MSWLDDFPGTRTVWTAISDLNGQARGKRLPASKAGKLFNGKAKMPMSALSLDIFGDDIEDSPLVFETGDKDGFLRPTERGAVRMPWLTSHSVLLPMSMEHGPDRPFQGDSRHALKRVLSGYEARGWTVNAATELEFFLIHEGDTTPLAERLRAGGDILGLRSLEAYDSFLGELYRACSAMGIPAETATSESGSGQFEVTLTHSSAIESADNTWLFKMLTKGLAQKHKMVATFMAKPFHDDAGTGMHMHFSVTDQDGENVFHDGGDLGSDVLRHVVGGCLATMAEATLIFAPHENSYHRLVPGFTLQRGSVGDMKTARRPSASRMDPVRQDELSTASPAAISTHTFSLLPSWEVRWRAWKTPLSLQHRLKATPTMQTSRSLHRTGPPPSAFLRQAQPWRGCFTPN